MAKVWSGSPSTSTVTGVPCWRETRSTPSTSSIWSPNCDGKPWKVGICTRKSLRNSSVDQRVVGRAQRGGQHADRRHDGETDHQRRRGGARTTRVAQRVLTGQLAGSAEQATEDRAARDEHGVADDRCEDGRGDHPDDRADADPDRVVAGGTDQPGGRQGDTDQHRDAAEHEPPAHAPLLDDEVVAHGGDRGDLGGAAGGHEGRDHGHDDPHDVGRDDRERGEGQDLAGDVEPEGPEQPGQHARQPEAQEQPDRRPDHAT